MVMKISPDLIPHHQFHKGLWLLSPRRSGWYYFAKRSNPFTIKSKSFIKSVDGSLRKLVKFLHRNKITTTPCCAGHHIKEKKLDKIYTSLEKDKAEIQGRGLKLKDVQTGDTFLYRNKNYNLPWRRKTFIKKLNTYQRHGIIGLKLGKFKKVKEQILQLKVKGAKISESESIVFIYVNGHPRKGNEKIWGELTRKIKYLFLVSGLVTK
jgi:hypothetical protein